MITTTTEAVLYTLSNWQATIDRYLLPLALVLGMLSVIMSLRYQRHDHAPVPPAVRDRNHRLVILSLVSLAGLLLIGYFFAGNRTSYVFDHRIASWAKANIGNDTLVLLAHLMEAGSTVWLICVTLAMGAWQWARDRPAVAFACVAAGAGNGLAIRASKAAFARVRPDHLTEIVSESSYSYPSGHAAGSVLVYGLLAWLVTRDLAPRRRLPAFSVALVLVFGIAATRVLLQVHYLTDVIGGVLQGICFLSLAIVWIRSRERRGAGQLATEAGA